MDYYLFGLQRSGTNYLRELLHCNFPVRALNTHTYCWKHSLDVPEGYRPQLPLVVITKNPYTWVESIAFRKATDWPRQKTYPASDPHNDPRLLVGQRKFNLPNMCKSYVHFHDTWLGDNAPADPLHIRYEQLLSEAGRWRAIRAFAHHTGVRRVAQVLKTPKDGEVHMSPDYDPARQDYYRRGLPKHLSSFQRDHVKQAIGDWFPRLGYAPE